MLLEFVTIEVLSLLLVFVIVKLVIMVKIVQFHVNLRCILKSLNIISSFLLAANNYPQIWRAVQSIIIIEYFGLAVLATLGLIYSSKKNIAKTVFFIGMSFLGFGNFFFSWNLRKFNFLNVKLRLFEWWICTLFITFIPLDFLYSWLLSLPILNFLVIFLWCSIGKNTLFLQIKLLNPKISLGLKFTIFP